MEGLLKNEGSMAIKTMKYKKTFSLTKAILTNYAILVSHCGLRFVSITFLSKHSKKNVLVKVNRTFKQSHFLCPKNKIRAQL